MFEDALNERGKEFLPGTLGLEVLEATREVMRGRLPVSDRVMAPNGFLHAATVIALADSLCGYGTVLNLPEGAVGFTTIELKSNFLGTALDGAIECEAKPFHRGRTTQVWDAVVRKEGAEKPMALFRCTQMVLWPKEATNP